jgi:hypothetical protein
MYKYQKNNLCNSQIPVTQVPVTQIPVTPTPVTPTPVTQVPVTPTPVTPIPVTQMPVTPTPVTPIPVTQMPVTPTLITQMNVWEQCGGYNIENKNCYNSICIKYSNYYSQCLPFELDKNMLCGQDDKKDINWKYNKCKNGLKCIQINESMDYRCI